MTWRALATSLLVAASALAGQRARQPAQPRAPQLKTEYDEATDSTTRSLSAYAIVDTRATPPDTVAVELTQRWKGRGLVAPAATVELALGRIRDVAADAKRMLAGDARHRPTVTFLLDGAKRVRLERDQYATNGGTPMTFETARYRLSASDLRLIAGAQTLRVWVGDRELWIDAAWRHVAADMVAGQTP